MATRMLKNHPIYASLQRMQELLDGNEFHTSELSSDEDAVFNRDKLKALAKALRNSVIQSSAMLVSESALNAMNTNLQNPIGELTAFSSNGNKGHLANAVGYIDQNVLNYVWAFSLKNSYSTKEDLGELVDSLRENTGKTLFSLEEQRLGLASKLSELSESIKAQDGRISELNEVNSKIRADSAAAVGSLEGAFNKTQTERDAAFGDFLTSAKGRLDAAENDYKKQALGAIGELQRHQADAARIVQVVGDIGVTGNYQNIAERETKQANLWRWITLGIFGAGLAMAAGTFLKFYFEPVSGTNTMAIAVRLLYALAIAAPAFYTARESARHRTNADRARQTELELASLGPFIELMKGEDKEEIRKSLISTYFGRKVEPHEVKPIIDTSGKQDKPSSTS